MTERPILFSGTMVRAILSGTKTVTRRIVSRQPPAIEAVRQKSGTDYSWFTSQHKPGPFRVAGPVWAVRELGFPTEIRCPYGVPGDRLWVRETWGFRGSTWDSAAPDVCQVHIAYHADGAQRTLVRPDAERHVGLPKQVCRCKATDPDKAREEHREELQRYWASWRPSIHMPRWASRVLLEVTDVRVERLQAITEEDAAAEGCGEPPFGTRIQTFELLWDSINAKRAPWSSNPWVWVVSYQRIENKRQA